MLDDGSIHNHQAEHYDEQIKKDSNDYLRENYFEIFNRVVILSDLSKGMKVLDIGVGTGLLTEMLPKGLSNFGIDISERMLEKAKEKNLPIKLQKGSFLNIPFANNEFNRIISTFAFHHLSPEEKVTAFLEMDRVLLKNGIIVIGDFMFKDKDQKKEVINKFKKEKRKDMLLEIEDEYFMDINNTEKLLNKLKYKVIYERASVLTWILKAKK